MSSAISHAALAIAAGLFDSLWQGVLIAGSVWLVLRCLPKLGAATRYAVWLCALAALVLIPVLSVSLSTQASEPALSAASSGELSGVTSGPVVQARTDAPQVASEPAVTGSAPSPAPAHKAHITVPENLADAVALAWLLLVCARGLLLLFDLRALAAVRRDARLWSAAHEYPVFLSDRVRVPLAAGFRRAAIILPASVVEHLHADDVETIVIHELAHLRRYDVWTNALARIVEALLAFNPAAWFVMRRLSLEREIACDDWVVTRAGGGDGFARTLAALAGSAGSHMPLAAPSAIGSRHSIVVRIERLLESGPRRLRLSHPTLGGALIVLAFIALAVQSVAPVLAYELPPLPPINLAQASISSPTSSSCPLPNRGIVMTHLLGQRNWTGNGPANGTELLDARKFEARLGPSHVAIFDLTVDAAGQPRKVVVLSPQYPGMANTVAHIYMASTYAPALRNCIPVTATIRTAVPIDPPEASTESLIVPVYPVGWSAEHSTACKVPSMSRTRFRPGYVAPNTYTAMLPEFPNSMKTIAIGAKFKTSVRVHVNAAGAATNVVLASTSGQRTFDDAALAAARRATYPLTGTDCKPLPADYVWHTTFERNSLLFRLGAAADIQLIRRKSREK